MNLLFFSVMGIVFGVVLSEHELDFDSDLSTKNNFFRFKKAINHALPGRSFFRINLYSSHPDQGKGKILRPIGHEVVETKKWTPIPKTHSDELQVQIRAIPSTTESYKPNLEASSVDVSPKSEPSEINSYKTTASEKGNVIITKVTTASTSNPKQGSRTTYLTFKPVSEEKYERTPYQNKVETAKKVINSQYNYKTIDNYSPTTSTYTTKYKEPEASYRETRLPSYSTTRKPVIVTLSQDFSHEPPKGYYEYHEHDLPSEIDIGYGYKLKLVYKPKKHTTYPNQYTATPKPSTNIYVSPHGSAYSLEKQRPSYETLKDHATYDKPHKLQNQYSEEVRYHQTPKYHSVPDKSSHHSHLNYEPKNAYSQSTHFNKFQSIPFKNNSEKEAPIKNSSDFFKAVEVLNLIESLDSSSRNNEGMRDGRVFKSEIDGITADDEETTTVLDDMSFVEDTTTIQNNQFEDEISSMTREPFQSTMTTSFPSAAISEQTTETASTSSNSGDAMTATRLVEIPPRTHSDIDTRNENEIQTTTEIITSTRNEDFIMTDVTTSEPETDIPRQKRKFFGYSWYLEG